MIIDNPEDKCSINKLKQDVPTRRNSTFLMLQSVFKLSDSIKDVLIKPENKDNKELLLKSWELEINGELFELFEPIHDFTKILSGSQYTTCSIILPAVFKFTDYFANFKSE